MLENLDIKPAASYLFYLKNTVTVNIMWSYYYLYGTLYTCDVSIFSTCEPRYDYYNYN